MRQVQQAVDAFDHTQLEQLQAGQNVELHIEGETIIITPEDVQVDRQVRDGLIAANSGHITIALDTALSEELLIEGLARELINKVNTMRREADFAVTDRIHLTVDLLRVCVAVMRICSADQWRGIRRLCHLCSLRWHCVGPQR